MDDWLKRDLVDKPEYPATGVGLVGYLTKLEKRIEELERTDAALHEPEPADDWAV